MQKFVSSDFLVVLEDCVHDTADNEVYFVLYFFDKNKNRSFEAKRTINFSYRSCEEMIAFARFALLMKLLSIIWETLFNNRW